MLNTELRSDLLSVESLEQGKLCRIRLSKISPVLSTKYSSQKLLSLFLHLLYHILQLFAIASLLILSLLSLSEMT